DPECVGGDTLTCGVCQKDFALADIVKFIQHKVLTCNKENNYIRSNGNESGRKQPCVRREAAHQTPSDLDPLPRLTRPRAKRMRNAKKEAANWEETAAAPGEKKKTPAVFSWTQILPRRIIRGSRKSLSPKRQDGKRNSWTHQPQPHLR
ncbi:Putative LOC100743078, partial [Caligus rogercresseyi]